MRRTGLAVALLARWKGMWSGEARFPTATSQPLNCSPFRYNLHSHCTRLKKKNTEQRTSERTLQLPLLLALKRLLWGRASSPITASFWNLVMYIIGCLGLASRGRVSQARKGSRHRRRPFCTPLFFLLNKKQILFWKLNGSLFSRRYSTE